MHREPFSKDILRIKDIEKLVNHLGEVLVEEIFRKYKRKGAVIGISGGIDSSVTMALAVKVLGKERIFGVMMPEKDSSPDSENLADKLAKKFGVEAVVENIRPALEGFKCYERRDEAVKRVFPEYDPKTYKMKIGVRQTGLYNNLPPLFSLTIIDKNGTKQDKILQAREYLQIVAASNFKQRARMSMVYYHAESLHYAVIGTPNKHEVEQGFFVKFGDGGSDVMPIAHLYKTQVYQMARYLEIPEKIIRRTPTTDTYSAEQTQEEFFYQLPFDQMDLFWYAYENEIDTDIVAAEMLMTSEEVKSILSII